MSSLGRDWGEILSRLNVSWSVKEVANIMSMINKRTTPIDEDEGLIKHVIYSPLIDLHTNINTVLSVTADISKTVDVDHYDGMGVRKLIPDNVRIYDLIHDNSNAGGITFPPPGITQFDTSGSGRKFMGGAKADGVSFMKIADHPWFDVNDLVIAV